MNKAMEVFKELQAEEDALAYVNSKRMYVIEELLSAGVPENGDNVKVILTALKDMDAQTLARKRIKVEEKANDIQAASAELIASVLASSKLQNNLGIEVFSERIIPMLPSTVPKPITVDGEMSCTIETQTYNEFIAKYDDEE